MQTLTSGQLKKVTFNDTTRGYEGIPLWNNGYKTVGEQKRSVIGYCELNYKVKKQKIRRAKLTRKSSEA